jgi:hypothetical protein
MKSILWAPFASGTCLHTPTLIFYISTAFMADFSIT